MLSAGQVGQFQRRDLRAWLDFFLPAVLGGVPADPGLACRLDEPKLSIFLALKGRDLDLPFEPSASKETPRALPLAPDFDMPLSRRGLAPNSSAGLTKRKSILRPSKSTRLT